MSRPSPPTYKTKEWPAYNEALKCRGSLTIWFDPAMTWEAAPTGALRTVRACGDIGTIDLATRKANCSVPDIVQLLLDGKLPVVGRLTDEVRLDSLLISAHSAPRCCRSGHRTLSQKPKRWVGFASTAGRWIG